MLGDQHEIIPEKESHDEKFEQKNTADWGFDNRNIRVSLKLIRYIISEKEGLDLKINHQAFRMVCS